MIEFDGMESWILSLLERPIEDIDREYADHTVAYETADGLQLVMLNRGERMVTLPDETFHALHRRLYGHACEDPLWSAILCNIGRPLPVSIAHDLLDRELGTGSLGFSRQEDEVMWRMAGMSSYDQALDTLAREFYTLETRTLAEFQDLLHRFPDSRGMLTHISTDRASSPEKETCLFDHIRQLPDADVILTDYHQQERTKHARTTTDIEEIQQLFETGDPYNLMGLADNLATPQGLLEAMLEIKNTSYAKGIRSSAKQTLVRQRRLSRGEQTGERK